MVRSLVLATLLAGLVVAPPAATDQEPARLNVKVVLVDAAGVATPVPRHTLLVSDNPPSAPPRRIVTALDGTGRLNLRPGSYIVESDQAVAFMGQAYRWFQIVDVAPDGDAVLELTADNAMVGPVTSSTVPEAGPGDNVPADVDPWGLLLQWQDSVVALWTPTAHASGFLVDQRGLIATSRRIVGTASSVEVQLTPTVKVAGTVLVDDPMGGVAIVRVHPTAVASLSPVPLTCTGPAMPLVDDQEVLTIGVSLEGMRDLLFGSVRRVTVLSVAADFRLRGLSPGGPVFGDDGAVVGLTSVAPADDERFLGDSPIVSVDDACAAMALVEDAINAGAPPDGTHLPVEQATTVTPDQLEDAVAKRPGDLEPYAMSSSDFDITFITPVVLYNGLNQPNGPTMDFSNWSSYVRDVPPALLIRVTPKQSESFWMKLARGAAWTQGASLPRITRFKAGFARLRASCGDAEVTPLHPFRLELRVSETEAVYEGLVVFAPDALGPECGTVTLTLYSEKDPEKGDTREVDPEMLRQIWDDFALYRVHRSS